MKWPNTLNRVKVWYSIDMLMITIKTMPKILWENFTKIRHYSIIK